MKIYVKTATEEIDDGVEIFKKFFQIFAVVYISDIPLNGKKTPHTINFPIKILFYCNLNSAVYSF